MYQPTGTSQQDTNLQGLLNQNYGLLSGQNNPYARLAPQFGNTFNALYNSPYAAGYQGAAGTAGGAYNTVGQNALMNSTALSGALSPALSGAGSVLNMGLDPQAALYNQMLQQTRDQANVANAQYGLTGQQAAGDVNQATTNFNLDWQNQELQRALAGLQGYNQTLGAVGNAGRLAGDIGAGGAGNILAGGSTPYTVGGNIGNVQTQALNDYINQLLGPATSTLPTIGAAQNYLNTGINASATGASQALQDYQAQQAAMGGLGGTLGGVLGFQTNSGNTIGGDLLAAALPFAGL